MMMEMENIPVFDHHHNQHGWMGGESSNSMVSGGAI